MLLITTLLALSIQLVSTSKFYNFPTSQNLNYTNILRTIVLNYKQFELVIHYDKTSQNIINDFLSKHSTVSTIFNHDFSSRNLTRPLAHQCLNLVVLGNPTTFLNYLNNVNSKDVVIFFTTPSTSSSFTSKQIWTNLTRIGRSIIIELGAKVKIFTICFYCQEKTGQLNRLKTITYEKFSENFPQLQPHDFRNFEGHLLKVVYIDYFPFIYCLERNSRGNEIICKKAFGIEYDLLKSLSGKFNFTFSLIQAPNYTYGGLIDGLVSGNYDLSIGGVTLTTERRKKLKFSIVLKFEETVFLFIYQRPFLLKISYLKGLISVKIWISVLTALLIISCCVFAIVKYCNNYLKLPYRKIVTVLLKSSLEQPIKLKKILLKQPTFFSLFASWWLFVMVINVIFKSRLTAYMIYPSVPPSTLKELIGEGYNFVGDKNRLFFYTELFSDEEKSLLLKSSNVQKNDVCEITEYIETHKAILAGEKSRNLYHSKLFCSHYYKKPPQNLDHFSTKTFGFLPYAWAFRFGTPFVDSFNYGIKQMMSGGFFKVWERDAFLNKEFRKFRKNVAKNDSRIDSDAFLMVCLLHLGAIFGSVLAFFMELGYFAWKNKGKKRNNRNMKK